jgi:uncharacterized protein YbjT (DUF2867 family)
MTNKAIIVGASGLIGSKLLNILLNSNGYDEVLSIARKKTRVTNTKLTQLVIDFDHLDNYAQSITGNALFCCLGTTKKQTPNLTDYRKIDHDYPVKLAEIALKNGVEQYHLVSSMGANAKSSSFYLKMKGDTEEDLKKVDLNSLFVYQPAMLIGHRKKARTGEWLMFGLMKLIDPLLLGSLKKYRSIPAQTVAMAMFKQSLKNKTGVFTYTSDKIKQLS